MMLTSTQSRSSTAPCAHCTALPEHTKTDRQTEMKLVKDMEPI